MSSGSEYNSSSPRRDHHREDNSRSRSRDKKDRQVRERQRERKIKVKVPELTSSLWSFRNFCNLQTQKISSDHLQKYFDRYKKEWEQRQSEEFMKQYRGDAWFSEKYNPEALEVLDRERKENCKILYNQFLDKFNHGFFDKINLSVTDPSEIGQVEVRSQQEQQQNNQFSHLLHQTIEVHVPSQTEIHLAPYFAFDQDLNTIFIKSVPRSISRYEIRAIVEKLEGYRSITMSDPVKKFNLIRYCWIQFDNEQHTNKAALSLSGLMIKNEPLVVSKSSTKSKRVKILKNYPRSRIDKDLDTLTKLIQTLDKQVGIEQNELLKKQFTVNSTKMDIFLIYLRKVHAYDYYAGVGFENERLLALKVSSAFLRIEADYEELQNVQTVFKKIQEKGEERAEKMNQSKDYMGMIREQIQTYVRDYEKLSKDAQKDVWKCHFCDKKFKSCDFLVKHIISKHEDIKNKKIQAITERLYAQDPQKIAFSTFRDQNDRFKKPYTPGFRRDRKREYRDFDEPQQEKTVKPAAVANKGMVNFLDI